MAIHTYLQQAPPSLDSLPSNSIKFIFLYLSRCSAVITMTLLLWLLLVSWGQGGFNGSWEGEGKNDSIFVNVPFVVLNASVLLLAIGKSTCCSALFNMHLSHLPKKSRKVTVDDGGFVNPKFFSFPRNESIMIKSLKGNWRLILSPPPAPFFFVPVHSS